MSVRAVAEQDEEGWKLTVVVEGPEYDGYIWADDEAKRVGEARVRKAIEPLKGTRKDHTLEYRARLLLYAELQACVLAGLLVKARP